MTVWLEVRDVDENESMVDEFGKPMTFGFVDVPRHDDTVVIDGRPDAAT